jgi:hypothetical protein
LISEVDKVVGVKPILDAYFFPYFSLK